MVHSDQPVFVPSAAELSDAPPKNKQDWLHLVIFEPQNKIQLTHSTYQVTTFLDFAPFMNGFKNVQNDIKSFKADVANPAYYSKIKHKNTNTGSSPLLNEQDLEALDYYLDKLFDVAYRKFLNAIDHIECHPTLQDESPSDARGKCSIPFSETGSFNTFDHSLTPTEELF